MKHKLIFYWVNDLNDYDHSYYKNIFSLYITTTMSNTIFLLDKYGNCTEINDIKYVYT